MFDRALALAQSAFERGEVPVGAVVVKDGRIVGEGSNRCVQDHDPSAHAEIVALRQAAATLGNYRLEGCELYVTLEPCAMCAGAIANARLAKVHFAAADAKAGAAGSVIDVFAQRQINHHTQVTSYAGTQAAAQSADLLSAFFKQRRHENLAQAKMNFPLRDDALRTPDEAFAQCPNYPWAPHYVADLPSLSGLRQHYLDEYQGQGSAHTATTYLCLHGNPAWSYLYRKMIPVFLAGGHRVVAPDLIGFGKSDKPKADDFHQFEWHRNNLLELVEWLDLRNVVLVVQDWGGILGLTLPMAAPHRYKGLLVMNTAMPTGLEPLSQGFLDWRTMCGKNPVFDIARLFARGNPHLSPAECQAYNAPFVNSGLRAGTRRFPNMVPDQPDAPGAALVRQAKTFWSEQWSGASLMAVGMQDPVLGWDVMQAMRPAIRGCGPALQIPQAGHFVQEHGKEIAECALEIFQ
jgi:tRNA(adenine34) deaminase